MPSSVAQDKRDEAIADFFKACTAMLNVCMPLIKTAVNDHLFERVKKGK